MTPRAETLAYRIWSYANPRGWDVSVTEIADALDVPPQRIGRVCRAKNWIGRLRAGANDIARSAYLDGCSVSGAFRAGDFPS